MIEAIAASAQTDPLANQANAGGLPQTIANAIKTAAVRTGVNFAYLLNKASQESGFNPNAQASNSSATGLYQFTSQTWLQMIKDHGAAYGLGNYAQHITTDASGNLHVDTPAARKAILDLRKDPTVSAEMAGELDKANLDSLKATVGGKIGATDLYLAHFLGAGGAGDFIRAMRTDPNASAANVVPDAAAANSSVFYTASGQPKSLAQIYQHFAQKFDSSPGTLMMASAGTTSAPAASTTIAPAMTLNPSLPTQNASPYMNVAAAAPVSIPAANPYTHSVTVGVSKPLTTSLYAAMAMAQMNIDGMNSLSAFNAMTKAYGGGKKSTDATAGLA